MTDNTWTTNEFTELQASIVDKTHLIHNTGNIALIEHAIRFESHPPIDSRLASNGALRVLTNQTGRSPKDRYLVEGANSKHIKWNSVNQELPRKTFEILMEDVLEHTQQLESPLFYSDDLYVGRDSKYSQPIRLITKYAWHHLFGRNFFIKGAQHDGRTKPWTILNIPSLQLNPKKYGINGDGIIAIDLDEKIILIVNRTYGGENWKAIFTAMNTLLPLKGVLPMHCGANITKHGGSVTLFLGLSGTGKTTLSADDSCLLVGDDGHIWTHDGISNLAGGCYAKAHGITHEREPLIWDALRFGAIMENVVLDAERIPDYEEGPENIRALYPMEFIDDVYPGEHTEHPNAIIFLTCDMYGVLPPVAVLTPEQAAYYYSAGYTTKIGSTEAGSKNDVEPTFSAYFGEVFFPLENRFYLDLFQKLLKTHHVPVYLVNTGWTGGPQGSPQGRRISIATSRNIIHAIQHGAIHEDDLELLPEHNLRVPIHLTGIDDRLLNPQKTWDNKTLYFEKVDILNKEFFTTMARKFPDLPKEIVQSGRPKTW